MENEEQYGALVYDKIVHETQLARLLKIADKEVWVPRSISEMDDKNIIWIKAWFLDKEDLWDFVEETEYL